jgi:hypothetical protein
MNSQKSFFGYCIKAFYETISVIGIGVVFLFFAFASFAAEYAFASFGTGYVTFGYTLIVTVALYITSYYIEPSVFAWNINRTSETVFTRIIESLTVKLLPYFHPFLKLLFFPLFWLYVRIEFIFKKEPYYFRPYEDMPLISNPGEFTRAYFDKDVAKKYYEHLKREYEEEKWINGENTLVHHPFILTIIFLNIISIIVFITGLLSLLSIVGDGSISPSLYQWQYFFEYFFEWFFSLFLDIPITRFYPYTSFTYSIICMSLAFVIRCLMWIWAVSGAHLYLEEV